MPPQLPLEAAASALGVALGVRLLLLLSRSRALKPLSAATSAAAAALKTPLALASSTSPLAALFAASKAASKSYKAARVLRPAARLPSLPSSKRLKAAFAAASLLRLAAAAPPPAASTTGFAALAILKSGYKLSKNSAKIIEGFLGLQVHKGFRNGVDALGVVIKVAVIASEVAVWVGGRCWGGPRGRCVRFLGLTRPSSLVLVGCRKSEARVVLLDFGTVQMDGEGCRFEELEVSELLCLAVPVPEETSLVYLDVPYTVLTLTQGFVHGIFPDFINLSDRAAYAQLKLTRAFPVDPQEVHENADGAYAYFVPKGRDGFPEN